MTNISNNKYLGRHVTDAPATEAQSHVSAGVFEVNLLENELAARRKSWRPLPNNYQIGALRSFADQVGAAINGAAAYAGGKAEVVCFADI
jgi:hypothetical protein